MKVEQARVKRSDLVGTAAATLADTQQFLDFCVARGLDAGGARLAGIYVHVTARGNVQEVRLLAAPTDTFDDPQTAPFEIPTDLTVADLLRHFGELKIVLHRPAP